MYSVIGLNFVLSYLVVGANASVTDATGVVWQTRSIAEAAATVSLYTMIFAAALSAVKLLQASAVPATQTDPLMEQGTRIEPAKRSVPG
jgi:hypothetical protein